MPAPSTLETAPSPRAPGGTDAAAVRIEGVRKTCGEVVAMVADGPSFVAAVETTPEGKARRVKLRRVKRFTKKAIKTVARRIVVAGSTVVTDGLRCFNAVAEAGAVHLPIVTGSGRRAARHPAFKAVNTVLSNIKTSIAATFHAGAKKHAPRCLAEFAWRFNRRYDLPAMIPRLAKVALRTTPMPYRLLILAEDHG